MEHCSQPSLSANSALTHPGAGCNTFGASKLPGMSSMHTPADQHNHAAAASAAAASHSANSPTSQADGEQQPQQEEGLKRLTAALTAVLSSGMASDYVEGLKPVLHNGKLAISTYIKLEDDPEPLFVGMFPSLPEAVNAQKQSQELVRHGSWWEGVDSRLNKGGMILGCSLAPAATAVAVNWIVWDNLATPTTWHRQACLHLHALVGDQ